MKATATIICAFLALILVESATAQSNTDKLIEAYERKIEQQQQQLDEMRSELEALKKAVGQSPEKQPAIARTAVEEQEPNPPLVKTKNDRLSITFSGRVHRMLMTVDDGLNTGLFFTDSEQGPTMLRFDAVGAVSDTFSIGATVETGFRQSRPFLVSQDNRDPSTSVNLRIAEAYFQSVRFGRLSLGRGFASAWLSPEIDLSGTQYASLLPVGMLAPGMKFVNLAENSLSNIQVLDHFVDVERLLLVDRIRYDSATFGPGLQLSGSVAGDGRWDTALRAKPKSVGDWTMVAGASYQNKPFMGFDHRYDAGLSVRHDPTGLNLTIAGSKEQLAAGRHAYGYVIKAGWLADLLSIGKTAFSLDYYSASNLRVAGDEAESYGLFAVQKWPAYGLDIYAGYRRYMVDRPDVALGDLDIYVVGVGFNF